METTTNQSLEFQSLDETRKNDMLWQLAKRRSGFKYSLLSYLVVNLFLNTVWFLSSGPGSYYWPIWPMLGWGVGLIFQYFAAYHASNYFSAESEYEKLKQKEKGNQ